MMEIIEMFEYEGWMSKEAQKFFEGSVIREERDGVSVVGSFIKLSSGDTYLPKKGDSFKKWENGSISLKKYQNGNLRN